MNKNLVMNKPGYQITHPNFLSTKTLVRRILPVIVFIILFTGCSSPQLTEVIQQPSPTTLIAGTAIAVETQSTLVSTVSHIDEEPIHFTFPTPASPPISLWRPPLSPVPWALGPFDHFYFSRPIAADDINWPLANYRYGGVFYGTDIIHTGIDLPNPEGTPVIAAAGGKIIWAGYGLYTGSYDEDDPYGLAVVIRHDFGYKGRSLNTVYAHLKRIDVEVGQLIETGDQLGVVGTTGATTGPHLHFEVRIENNSFFSSRNPELWLSPPQGWGVLVGRVMKGNGNTLYGQEVTVISEETGKHWTVYSYGGAPANSDDYYQENVVLSDLPAGKYQVEIKYDEESFTHSITIFPGAISYFTFWGEYGFYSKLPSPASP